MHLPVAIAQQRLHGDQVGFAVIDHQQRASPRLRFELGHGHGSSSAGPSVIPARQWLRPDWGA